MRSYKIFGIKDGGAEEYVNTVHSAEEGKTVHAQMKAGGYYDEMLLRDALGGKHIHRRLSDGVNLMPRHV